MGKPTEEELGGRGEMFRRNASPHLERRQEGSTTDEMWFAESENIEHGPPPISIGAGALAHQLSAIDPTRRRRRR